MTLRPFLLLLLVLSSANARGQKSPEDYMEEARSYQYFQGKLSQRQLRQHDSIALADYKYIVEQHPTNTLCLSAYYNIARIYEAEHREEAIATYHTVIALAMKEKSSKGRYRFFNEGGYAAHSLCDYYEQRGNYDSALYYLGVFDTVLPVSTGCGNGDEAETETNTVRYADINLKANRVDAAEISLLSRSEPSWLGARTLVIEKLRELFKRYERPAVLKTEIDKAVNHYVPDTVIHISDGNADTSLYCTILFKGAKIRFLYERPGSQGILSEGKGDSSGMPEKEKIIAFLKKSDLYKMVQGL